MRQKEVEQHNLSLPFYGCVDFTAKCTRKQLQYIATEAGYSYANRILSTGSKILSLFSAMLNDILRFRDQNLTGEVCKKIRFSQNFRSLEIVYITIFPKTLINLDNHFLFLYSTLPGVPFHKSLGQQCTFFLSYDLHSASGGQRISILQQALVLCFPSIIH